MIWLSQTEQTIETLTWMIRIVFEKIISDFDALSVDFFIVQTLKVTKEVLE